MTRNDRLKAIKSKLVVLLALIMAFSIFAFTLVACNKKTDVTDPSYTYSETDDSKFITNSAFSYNLRTKLYSDFPVASPSGWSKSTENSTSSTVNSGVIDTTDKGWEELLTTLYKDSDFVSYVRNTYKAEITAAVGKDSPSDTELNDYIKEHKGYYEVDGSKVTYLSNPAADKTEAQGDNYVYMLNNYAKSERFGFGTAQKVTSSSSVSVAAGKTYKLSVWVKTVNLTHTNDDSALANIRLTNSVGGNSQAEYRLEKIDTNGEWKQYTIYIKGDADYDSTFTLVLALGYGGKDTEDGKRYAEGTVYFDNVLVEELEDGATVPVTADNVVYGSTEAIAKNAANDYTFAYDMSLVSSVEANFTSEAVTLPGTGDFTSSNISESGEKITSKTIAADSSVTPVLSTDGKELKLTLNKASYTVNVKNGSADFTLGAKSYAYFTFEITNKLSKFGSTAITVDAYEKKADGSYKKTAAVTTYSDVSDDAVKCELLFKNNFESGNREFYISVVAGPADIASVKTASALASGEVTIADMNVIYGKTDSDEYKTPDYKNGTDNPAYKLYSFFASKADATVALYADHSADHTDDNDSESYNISVAPGNFGDIVSYPTAPKGYYGITAKHIYTQEPVNGEELATAVNDRLGTAIRANVSFAGLINSKYLENYASEELKTALNHDAGEDPVQPIAIYNATAEHYGFIGAKNTVAASAYAKVTVTLRVADGASAYLYLVDVSGKNKDVMEFVQIGEDTTARKLERVITAENLDANGWVTVNFYVATGANSKDFRVEVWNGGRDGETATASKGYVFVSEISVTTSSAFTEPTNVSQAFASLNGNPLTEAGREAFEDGNLISYTRKLTDTEKKFNKQYPKQAVSYKENYVWAENATMVYAIYNTLDPVESDPYANVDDDNNGGSGCNVKTDSSSFWLGFSSILLAVVLVLAILALIVKRVRSKRKANRKDAKSHYTVKSRVQTSKTSKKPVKKVVKEEPAEEAEETATESEDNTESETPAEQNLDDYVYGEVQNFGDAETNEDKPSDEENK